MIKKLSVIAATLLLSGCFNDLSSVQQYIADVKATTTSQVQPLPKEKEFVHIPYNSQNLRSPFVAPSPEAIQEKFLQVQDCLHPDPRRKKEPLEQFPLDNLKMRGTLGDKGDLWGLIEASDKSLHRVTIGNYAGLFNGRVISVKPTVLELLELIPDGAGCWKERTTMLQMVEPTVAASN